MIAETEYPDTDLFIVITDFNGADQTKRCLNALRASHFQRFTALVVDHGTEQQTKEMLAAEYPEVIRIFASSELWWAGATNLGVQAALVRGANTLMLLNNDCYVEPETIGILMRLSHEQPGTIIAPIQRDWHTGSIICLSPRSNFLLGFPTVPGPRRLTSAVAEQTLLPVKLIGGGRGVVIPASVLERLNHFDAETLPHYGADHDFYLRARRHGFLLYVATQAFVDIDDSRTTSANRPERLSLHEFMNTLRSIRSHRNLRHVNALFRKHYPVPGLYPLGVLLYTGRYLLVYLTRRLAVLLGFSKQRE